MVKKRLFMKKYFFRGAILVSIGLLYFPISQTKSRTKTRSIAINQTVLNIIGNIEKFTDSYIGRYLIKKIIENDSKARLQVISYIVNNFDRLIKSQAGRSLIAMIIKSDLSARQQIISYIMNNFKRLIESWNRINLIENIMEKDPDARQQIIPHIISNIKFAGSLDGRLFIEDIIEKYPDVRQQIIPCIVNNFEKLIKSWDGILLIKVIIEKYPDVRQQIIQYIVSNFDRLIESFKGKYLIKNIVKNDPDVRQQITPCIVNNFEKLIESWEKGIDLINAIIENDPSARQQIIPRIVNNFDRLIEAKGGTFFIKVIIGKDPDARQQITPCIVNNFEKLIKSWDGIYLIGDIIKKDSSARQQIAKWTISNVEKLIELERGRSLIKVIMESDPIARQQIIPCIVNNFEKLIKSWDGILLIKVIIENDLSTRQQIIPRIINNFDRLVESYYGERLLIREIIEYPDVRQQIVLSVAEFPYRWKAIIHFIESESARAQILSCIKENYKETKITKLPLIIFCHLCEEFPHDECLRNKLKKDSHEYGIEGVIKRFCYLQSCPEKKNDRLKSSLPTVKHIERYRKIIIKLIGADFSFIRSDAFSSNFLSMLDRTFRKEVELEKSGYIAFKHGQRWGYGLSEKWFTTLWAITKEKSITDFIFLHVKPLVKDENLTDETEMRERLLMSGRSSNDDRQHLLFMNYALFGNTGNLGNSSVGYAAGNDNVGSINISLKNVFNYLGHKYIYKKYEKQLQELEQEYKGLSKYGSMVVIGVPEDKLADSVYLATDFGQKVKMYIEGIGETDDIKTIIVALRYALPERIKNSDLLQFVLIMTQDKHGGLNPESGIKVHLFDAADPEKLAVFRKKESLLLEQIKQEVEQEKSKKSTATAGQFIRSAL